MISKFQQSLDIYRIIFFLQILKINVLYFIIYFFIIKKNYKKISQLFNIKKGNYKNMYK